LPTSAPKKSSRSRGEQRRDQTLKSDQDSRSDLAEGNNADSIIKEYCHSQWGEDFAMRAYCEKTEKEAFQKIESSSYEDVPQDVLAKIRDKAAEQWPHEFGMRLHTEKEQVAAYRKLMSK